MPEVKKDEKHETVTVVHFTPQEVAEILGQAALDAAPGAWPLPNRSHRRGRKVEVRLKQQTEGSPAYNVDKWDAIVTVTEDHLHVAAAAPEVKS